VQVGVDLRRKVVACLLLLEHQVEVQAAERGDPGVLMGIHLPMVADRQAAREALQLIPPHPHPHLQPLALVAGALGVWPCSHQGKRRHLRRLVVQQELAVQQQVAGPTGQHGPPLAVVPRLAGLPLGESQQQQVLQVAQEAWLQH
jgi:hypothetical protein